MLRAAGTRVMKTVQRSAPECHASLEEWLRESGKMSVEDQHAHCRRLHVRSEYQAGGQQKNGHEEQSV